MTKDSKVCEEQSDAMRQIAKSEHSKYHNCVLQVLEGVEPNEHGTWQVLRFSL